MLDDGEVDNNGNPNRLPQERELQRLIDDANYAFSNADAPTNIRFYMKTPRLVEVNNSDMSDTRLFFHVTNPASRDGEAINVYIRSGTDKGQYFNPTLDGYIVLNRVTYTDSGLAATMAHELGHYLGLAHTHQWVQTPCFREPVVRGNAIAPVCVGIGNYNPFAARCSYTGDALCDTEADPNMSWSRSNYNSANCTHDGDVQDYRGDTYRPLPRNYMAYGNRAGGGNNANTPICRSQFTRDQVGAMQYTLEHNWVRGRFGLWKVDVAGRSFDIYEPNNTINGAENVGGDVINAFNITLGRRGITNVLQINETQTHSFHKNLDGDMMDNFDWIPIEVPPNGVFDNYIITAESTIPNLIQDIEVFTSMVTNGVSVEVPLLARVVSDTEPNQTRWEISIPCEIVNNPNRLFLRVRRNQNLNEFGTYTIFGESDAPEISVDGEPETICAGTTYLAKLENFTLTPDFTIVWEQTIEFDNGTVSPTLEIVAARNQIQANFSTSELSGVFVLQATITNNLTGCSETIEREFRIGKIPVVNLEIEKPFGIDVQNLCPSLPLFLLGNLIETNGIDWSQIEEIEWETSNLDFTIVPSADGRRLTVIPSSVPNDVTLITFKVRNACGWSEQVLQLRNGKANSETCIGGGDDNTISIYPNPTDDFIDIDIICMCGIDPADPINPNPDPQRYSISRVDISDMFGTTRLSYEGKQIPINSDGKIRLNLSQLPSGNYILKLVMQEKVYMKHVIKK